MSETRPASGTITAEKKVSETIRERNEQDAIVDILNIIYKALAGIMTPEGDDRNMRDDSRMAVMVQVMIGNVVSRDLHSVTFDIRLR